MSLAARIVTEFLDDAARTKALAGEALNAFGEAFARALSSVELDATSPQFGASVDNTGAQNRVAFQAAFDYAAGIAFILGLVVSVYVPPGDYNVEVTEATWWEIPLLGSSREFHGAVALRSGVVLRGSPGGGSVISATLPAALAANTNHYFAPFAREEETGILTDAIDLERLGFQDLTFTFDPEHWPATHSSIYSVMAVGVDGFRFNNIRTENLTGVAGDVARGARCMNCRNVTLDGFDSANLAQGLYLNYCDGVFFRGRVSGAHEGIDIDQTCSRVVAFLDYVEGTGSEQQAIDVAGCTDSYFELTGNDFGSCGVIYTKPDCHPTFAEYLEKLPLNEHSTNPVQSARVHFKARASNVHSTKFRAFQVSLRRDDTFGTEYWTGKGLTSDITVDIALEDADPVIVHEVKNIQGRISVRNSNIGAATPTIGSNNMAVLLRSEHLEGLAESQLSGSLRIDLEDCQYGGVLILAPTDLHVTGSIVGYNSEEDTDSNFGWAFERLLVKPGRLSIQNLQASGGDLTVQPHDLRLGYTAAGGLEIGTTQIVDHGGHRFTSGATTPVNAPSSGARFSKLRECLVPVAMDTVTNATQQIPIFTVPDGARLLDAAVLNYAAVPQGGGGGTDHTVLSMRRVRAGSISSAIGTAVAYDDAAITAGTTTSLGVSGSDSDGLFQGGDVGALQGNRAGAGSVLLAQNLFVRYALLEWAST